jgi:predicted lipoprotein with Yx(FWY)xxD motif
MHRTRLPMLAAFATAALTAGAGTALGSGPLASPAGATTVKLAKTGLGQILVSKSNRTLYMFTRDKHRKDACVAISMCPGTWPPYTVKGKPSGGPGLKASLLGTTTIGHGKKQVTYAGHPLYIYSGDTTSKETDYVGAKQFGGSWYAVSAAGKAVK